MNYRCKGSLIMTKKSLDEQLKELEDMLSGWYTKDREEELMRVQLQRKVKEIRKYSEGVIKI